jgi:opacity protein-like surface antigen
MKKLLFVLLSSAATTVFAGGFDGPFVQAYIGAATSQSKISSDSSIDPPSINSNQSETSFLGQIAGGYSHSFGSFNLAGSAFYNVGDQNAGTFNSARSTAGSNLNLTGKLSNTWGVAIEPGWNFDSTTLGYAKFAYVGTTYKLNDSYTEPGYSQSGSGNTNFNGVGYGVGLKKLIDKNIYVGGEVVYTQFNSKTDGGLTLKPNQMSYMIGLGYKF